jgi:NADH dehydrogenase
LAGGSATNYFGNKGFENFGQGLKTVTDALDIRSRLLQNLEKASVTCIKKEKEALSSIVIVGGGATGVELAGAIAEFKRYILPKDYPELENIEMQIFLIEATDRLLQSMPAKLSEKTCNYLAGMKVNVLLNSTVSSYDGTNVVLSNGQILHVANFIWTAGVKGKVIEGLPASAITRQHRIEVDPYSRIQSLENVFAIGDVALMNTEVYPNGHPMVAQTAIQQGKTLAANLMKMIRKESLTPFEYHDRGSLATIGKRKAVASKKKMEFGGIGAWLIWSFIHLMSIVGVRNKVLIAVNWLWNYFTYDKGDRVIIRRYKEEMTTERESAYHP